MQLLAAGGCLVCIGVIWGCRVLTGFRNLDDKGDV
jgi:hypothetical protein